MIRRFPKSCRLRSRRQFQRLSHNGKRHVGPTVAIDYRYNSQGVTRLGITVTKRYGIAPLRNRFKRIVREAFRLCRHQLPVGLDLNVKPRHQAAKASTHDIINDLMGLNARTSPQPQP